MGRTKLTALMSTTGRTCASRRIRRKIGSENPSSRLEGCLPLHLQDLCLLVVINELETYPVELLASLPCWLRQRLLDNIPVLDLCRLDHTSVTEGIDIKAVWHRRWPPQSPDCGLYLPQYGNEIYVRTSPPYIVYDAEKDKIQGLETNMDLDYLYPTLNIQEEQHTKDEYLHVIAMTVLYNSTGLSRSPHSKDPEYFVRDALCATADWLISMRGNLLMKEVTGATNEINLYSRYGSDDDFNCPHYYDYRWVWKLQGTALATYQAEEGYEADRLAPHRLLPIRSRKNVQELISLLVQHCHFQMSSVLLDIPRMLDTWISVVKSEEVYDPLLHSLFRNLLSLGMCVTASGDHEWPAACQTVATIIKAVVGDGLNCHLRGLDLSLNVGNRCGNLTGYELQELFKSLSPYLLALPGSDQCLPLYGRLHALDITGFDLSSPPFVSALLEQHVELKFVYITGLDTRKYLTDKDGESKLLAPLFKALCSLFSRPNFELLCIGNGWIMGSLIDELLKSFMSSKCLHNQHLMLESVTLDPNLEPSDVQVASVDMNNTEVPECGVQHKRITTMSMQEKAIISGAVLQLPKIRLNELYLEIKEDNYPLLHLAAEHPDLHVATLNLRVGSGPYPQLLTTLHEDIKTLLKKPSLSELYFKAVLGIGAEVKEALLLGIQQQIHVCSLLKITINLHTKDRYPVYPEPCSYTKSEFTDLWSAIFSLPQLPCLEVIVTKHFTVVVQDLADAVIKSWKKFASGRQMKLLCLQTSSEKDLKALLSSVAVRLEFLPIDQSYP